MADMSYVKLLYRDWGVRIGCSMWKIREKAGITEFSTLSPDQSSVRRDINLYVLSLSLGFQYTHGSHIKKRGNCDYFFWAGFSLFQNSREVEVDVYDELLNIKNTYAFYDKDIYTSALSMGAGIMPVITRDVCIEITIGTDIVFDDFNIGAVRLNAGLGIGFLI
jgi:hypothetical protein